jgi:hypothetical protein
MGLGPRELTWITIETLREVAASIETLEHGHGPLAMISQR